MNLGIVSMAVLTVVSLPPGGCGGLFNADLQVNDVCKTLEDQEFPAVPAELSAQQRLTRDFTMPVGEVLDKLDFVSSSSLRLKSLSVQPTEGIDDLGGVEEAMIRLSNGGQGTTLTDYRHSPGSGPVPVLTLDVQDIDVSSFLSEGELTVSADLMGSLPTVPWKAKVTACFAAAVSL